MTLRPRDPNLPHCPGFQPEAAPIANCGLVLLLLTGQDLLSSVHILLMPGHPNCGLLTRTGCHQSSITRKNSPGMCMSSDSSRFSLCLPITDPQLSFSFVLSAHYHRPKSRTTPLSTCFCIWLAKGTDPIWWTTVHIKEKNIQFPFRSLQGLSILIKMCFNISNMKFISPTNILFIKNSRFSSVQKKPL